MVQGDTPSLQNGRCLGNAGCSHFLNHHMNYFIEFSQEPYRIYKTLMAISDGEMAT